MPDSRYSIIFLQNLFLCTNQVGLKRSKYYCSARPPPEAIKRYQGVKTTILTVKFFIIPIGYDAINQKT